MRTFKRFALSSSVLLVLACTSEPAPESSVPSSTDAASPESLSGEVFYLDRRALSDQAELIVELSASGQQGSITRPLSRPLNGQQVPIAFELPLPQALDRSTPIRLRAAILEPDGTARIGSSAEITLTDTTDIGELRLAFIGENDYQATYRCGDAQVHAFSIGERLILAVDGARQILRLVPAASGTRYINENVEFWMHQGQARLTIDGQERPECLLLFQES